MGITVDAVRSRVKRNTIAYERTGGRVYVLLDTDQVRPGHDLGSDQVAGAREDRTAELIATLREQLEAERRANEENRRIIAALTSRIPELPPPGQEEESQPAPETPPHAREYAVTPQPQPGRVGPQTAVEGPQEGVERPWWRRVFGR